MTNLAPFGSVRDSWTFLKRLAPREAFWISGVLYLSHGLGYRRPMTHPQGCADPPSIHTRLPAKPPPQRLFPLVSLLEQPHLVRRHSHSLQSLLQTTPSRPLIIIPDYCRPTVAMAHHMIEPSRIFHSRFSWHAKPFTPAQAFPSKGNSKLLGLPPPAKSSGRSA